MLCQEIVESHPITLSIEHNEEHLHVLTRGITEELLIGPRSEFGNPLPSMSTKSNELLFLYVTYMVLSSRCRCPRHGQIRIPRAATMLTWMTSLP